MRGSEQRNRLSSHGAVRMKDLKAVLILHECRLVAQTRLSSSHAEVGKISKWFFSKEAERFVGILESLPGAQSTIYTGYLEDTSPPVILC